MSSVKIINMTKQFNKEYILKNINLDIKQGEFITLLGESGCGKSTTLNLIAGLIKPTSGDILFDGISVLDINPNYRQAVVVFQDYCLFPHMTVFENIEFGLKVKKINKKLRINKVKELLELVQLEGSDKKFPHELSGGQKQRVAIARTLAVNPKVLLLDEPFSNLDINLKNNMMEFILNIQKQLEITTILVTHDKEEALMMSDKIAVMIDGEIAQFDTPINLYENPVSKRIANIFGERNYIKGNIKNGKFLGKGIDLQLDTATSENIKNIELMVSKEDIHIYDIKYDNGINCYISKKIYLGNMSYYEVNVGEYVLKIHSPNNLYEVNNQVKIKIRPKNTIFLK